MDKGEMPSKGFLLEEYIDKHRSVDAIAEELGIAKTTLHRLFKRYEIKKRSSAESILPKDFKKPSKEELERWYNKEGKSVIEIAKVLHVSSPTVRSLLEKHGFKVRNSQEQFVFGKKLPTKETLEELRHIKKLSFDKIGKMFGFKSGGPIKRLVKGYEISYKKPIRKYPHNYWTKDKVISEILALYKKSISIRSTDVKTSNTSLLHAAYKLFGNWQSAVEAAGIDYNSLLKNPWKYNKEGIKKQLIELHHKKVDLSDSCLRKYDAKFYSAVTKRFSSIGNALSECGIDPHQYYKQKPTGYWTKERVLSEIKKLIEQKEDLAPQNIRKKYPKLWNISHKKFGGWINVLRDAHINPKTISRLYANTKEFKEYFEKEATPEKLIELYYIQKLNLLEIGEIYGCGYKPVQRLMKKYDLARRLPLYSRKDWLTCKDGDRVQSSYERKVDDILYANNIPHEYNVPYLKGGSRKYRTDFKITDTVFVEVKGLSGHHKYGQIYEQKFKEKESWLINAFTRESKTNRLTLFTITPKQGKLTKQMIVKELTSLIRQYKEQGVKQEFLVNQQ